MSKLNRRQQSLGYHAKCVIDWRAKGWNAASINRMLVSMLTLTRSVHANPAQDAVLVLEIANGTRCA